MFRYQKLKFLLLAVLFVAPPLSAEIRPDYSTLRYDEDWSGFYPKPQDPLQDRVKHLSVSSDGLLWASLGGSARIRVEDWNNHNFSASQDDTFALLRLFAHADFHYSDNWRVFAEIKSAASTDRDLAGGRRPTDEDNADLQNLFAEVKLFDQGSTASLRLGRQEILFGRERLVSPNNWTNARQTFDGIRGWFVSGDNRLDAFYTRPVEIEPYDFNETSDDVSFWGIYGQLRRERLFPEFDYYYLNRHRTTNSEDRYTPGVRLSGNIYTNSFTYDVEGAFQMGEYDVGAVTYKIHSRMFAGELGYQCENCRWDPEARFRYDYASGDKNPTDNNDQTFDPLFPNSHKYLGYADILGRRNISAIAFGGILHPDPARSTFQGWLHFFNRASSKDGIYDPNGSLIRSGTVTGEKEIGKEIDLLMTYKIFPDVNFELGYSHFFAGQYITKTTPNNDEDVRFLYSGVEWMF